MRRWITCCVVGLMAIDPTESWASQREVPANVEVQALQRMAAAIPPGSRVKVQTMTGRRLTATLMSTTDDGIVLKRESRVPEPAITIRFDELARLQRDERGGGLSIGKALGIGLAAGAGAILTLFAVLFSIDD